MEVPGLGKVMKDEEVGWYTSNPIAIPMFGGKQCRVVLKGYDEDANRHEFHAAIANFLSGRPEVLQSAERDLVAITKISETSGRIRAIFRLSRLPTFGITFTSGVNRWSHAARMATKTFTSRLSVSVNGNTNTGSKSCFGPD
jgi:hypothetical protein